MIVLTSPPVDPSAPDAHDWLVTELAKPEYQAAKPTWFDLASKAVADWFAALFAGRTGAFGSVLLVAAVVLVVAIVVAAFVVYGMPRLNRRRRPSAGGLFGDAEHRTSDDLRTAARRAAANADWAVAIEEQFRAIARALDERTVVQLAPGTTAREFAHLAADAFPDSRAAFAAAATAFDGVRYLERVGTREAFDAITQLDADLRHARPVSFAPPREHAL